MRRTSRRVFLQDSAAAGAVALGSGLALDTLSAMAATPASAIAWGANAVGQLGDGSFAAHLAPHAVSGLSGITGIHGGRQHVIALRSNGSVWCWGHGLDGQLGIGSTANRNVPTKTHNLANVKQVRTGHYHSMALRRDGTVWTWGLNKYGQLGDGTTQKRLLPVRVKGLPHPAIAIAGARDHSLAILNNGTVWAWGLNQYGNLGTGNTVSHHLPVQVKGLSQIIAIAGGRDHSLAIKKGGAVYAWGWNAYGQIGDGTTVNRHLPKHVAQLTGVAVQITAGANHSVVRRKDGSVWAFGQNSYGQIGDGTGTQRKRRPG